jgi:hypothetical protein
MLRHVVLFRLIKDAPEGTVRSLQDGLSHLARSIPDISSYSHGLDLGLREGNFDLAVVADFIDEPAFKRYVDHPDHQAFVADKLQPVLAERVALQFDY